MGIISRKIFPACGNMCVCCPALRSRSRQPVKRYKKLLAEIFPKSPDASPNERKIVKLCEYAGKNPFRIPKIAKYLEERCYKELRHESIKFIHIVGEVYNKLLSMCKEQMAYFAVSLLAVVTELLESSKSDAIRIIGCQTLTRFIYSQVDGTYILGIESLVGKVCGLARESGEQHQKRCLRASSLHCLSAMVWYMMEFSHVFVSFDEIVHVALDNYDPDILSEEEEKGDVHHNWVDEIVRCEGRGGAGVSSKSSSCLNIRPRPERKDPSQLTREEAEMPKIWAQICILRMVELGKESTTMRRVLDSIFIYFDTRRHWIPHHGFAFIVLSDICYHMESSGNQQLILTALIRHLDHKNVAHDPHIKSHVVQIATSLSRQIRSGAAIKDIGYASDLCRHLRKSLQSTAVSTGDHEFDVNIGLQNSIENCLLETAKGIADPQPLFDLMAITLEKLPSVKDVARATIRSLIILANMISLVSVSSRSLQVFPESLLVQLLRVMLHPDVEIRVGGHQIFSVLLIPSSNHPRHNRRSHSNTGSVFASITALLEKLRKEKDGSKAESRINVQDDNKEHENSGDEWKQGRTKRNSPSFQKLSCIIDRTAGTSKLPETEPCIMKFSEDQIAQMLSAFWIQASFSDNLPSNVEAISHSFCLTLLSSRLRNPNENVVVRFFQLPISLVKVSLDLESGMLPPAYQRSLFVLSIAMLMFVAKIYLISDLIDFLKPLVESDIDPYVGINKDFQVFLKPQVDAGQYGSSFVNDTAASFLFDLRNKFDEYEKTIVEILVLSLSRNDDLEKEDLKKLLSEPFTPDEACIFGPQSTLDFNNIRISAHSKDSPSDGDFPANSLIEDDAVSESSVSDLSHATPKIPTSASMSRIISIGQLLESALEVAGQVAGTSISTSPLPYSAMTSQCEAFGIDTRKKLSSWLVHENQCRNTNTAVISANVQSAITRTSNEEGDSFSTQGAVLPMESRLALRLPPASPFDNFLRAARC